MQSISLLDLLFFAYLSLGSIAALPSTDIELCTENLLSPIHNNGDYRKGLNSLCSSILQESFLDKVLEQNNIIKVFKNKKDKSVNNIEVVEHSRSLQNPSSKLGCIVNAQVLEQLKLKSGEKKRRLHADEIKRNETVFKKAKLLIHNNDLLIDLNLTFHF